MSDTENSLDARTAVAADDHAGWRLDRFLAASLPDFSRSRLQQLLEGEAVSLGARTIKDANHRVKPGETYTVMVPPTAPPKVRPSPEPVRVPVLLRLTAPVPPTMELALPRVTRPAYVPALALLLMRAPPELMPVPFKVKGFEKPHQPNLTGTAGAYRPQGSLLKSGQRPSATGDYQAWKPE